MSRQRVGDGGDGFNASGWVLSREAVRRVDALAVERYGVPSIVLMENAAIGLRERALAMLEEIRSREALILAGTGNNGGDGLALARHLHNEGCDVSVLLAGDPEKVSGDAAVNLTIARRMNLPLERLDRSAGAEVLERSAGRRVLVVDALLGTGLSDAARGTAAEAIGQLNRIREPGMAVLAVDVPSGLDCDTGEPAGGGAAVQADATVTFVALKPGFLRLDAQRWTGEVHVAGIGAPRELVEELGVRLEDARRGERGGDGGEPGPAPEDRGRAAGRGG